MGLRLFFPRDMKCAEMHLQMESRLLHFQHRKAKVAVNCENGLGIRELPLCVQFHGVDEYDQELWDEEEPLISLYVMTALYLPIWLAVGAQTSVVVGVVLNVSYLGQEQKVLSVPYWMVRLHH